jgi:hypothetical protein
MSQGQMIAGVAAVLLFIFTFLPWFSVEGADSENIWKVSGSPYDVFLLITVAVGIAAALGVGSMIPGVTIEGAAALLGTVAAITLLWLLIDFPDGVDRGIGLFLALLAAIGIAYGGYSAAQEEGGAY